MWKDIKGFEGRYQMSDEREVKRLPYSVTQKGNVYNRTLVYKPDITDFSKYQKYRDKENAKPYMLRFGEDGKRKTIGYFNTYEEAENKYRELYNERQKRIDANN